MADRLLRAIQLSHAAAAAAAVAWAFTSYKYNRLNVGGRYGGRRFLVGLYGVTPHAGLSWPAGGSSCGNEIIV
jgi:ammonia channel protein AmtB